MVTVDKTLLSSVRQIMDKTMHRKQKKFYGWLNTIKGHFKIFLFSKYNLFSGSDQCNFVLGDRVAIQLQLNEIPENRLNLNNSVYP